MPDLWREGLGFLADAGLNLTAVFPWNNLPDKVQRPLHAAGLDSYTHLLLTAHGGTRLWSRLTPAHWQTADPIDNYSLSVTNKFLTRYLGSPPHQILYPHPHLSFPLAALGELAGWGRPSPLGLGIHPEYGLWYAYRTAVAITADLPTPPLPPPPPHPCHTCADKPCTTTCPVVAVQHDQFAVMTCVTHRTAPHSSCAHRCLARLACPVAPQHRYTDDQIRYHYAHSLRIINGYLAEM